MEFLEKFNSRQEKVTRAASFAKKLIVKPFNFKKLEEEVFFQVSKESWKLFCFGKKKNKTS